MRTPPGSPRATRGGRGTRARPACWRPPAPRPPLAKRRRLRPHAAWLAARDPRCPWYARAFGLFVTAYALSPVDLIPDFIPVLGLLDDALLIPLGLWLFIKLLPPGLLEEH